MKNTTKNTQTNTHIHIVNGGKKLSKKKKQATVWQHVLNKHCWQSNMSLKLTYRNEYKNLPAFSFISSLFCSFVSSFTRSPYYFEKKIRIFFIFFGVAYNCQMLYLSFSFSLWDIYTRAILLYFLTLLHSCIFYSRYFLYAVCIYWSYLFIYLEFFCSVFFWICLPTYTFSLFHPTVMHYILCVFLYFSNI